MNIRTIHPIAAAGLALALSATTVVAQPAAPAAPAAAAPAEVPVICTFSTGALISSSALGKQVLGRLDTIGAQAQAEIDALRTPLDADARQFQSEVQALPAGSDTAPFEQRQKALQDRAAALQALASLRQREVEATETKAMERIDTEVRPVMLESVQQHRCSMVINQEAMFYLRDARMDITPDVRTRLDAKITQIAFERERLDQQQAPASAVAPAGPARAGSTAPARAATPAPGRGAAPARGGR